MNDNVAEKIIIIPATGAKMNRSCVTSAVMSTAVRKWTSKG
jgi:hypothetical protein